MVLLYLPIVL
ncbi:hypothetical protein PR048_015745 [Dryococelus australis]|uniref:Uncharacterized protein n=1 Tax=Dryococelus australis TaxID=614101 RepID=A0ABQ9HHS9_9NEOP|nr:hypothetical protein PR048_015745 [Dryococelus australis]